MCSAPYEEFALLRQNADEYGLAWEGDRVVERRAVEVEPGRSLSVVVWGGSGPDGVEMVLLHGGAQNAHTWDTVCLALGRPLMAIDLPGHGHSDWRVDHSDFPSAFSDVEVPDAGAHDPRGDLDVGQPHGGQDVLH